MSYDQWKLRSDRDEQPGEEPRYCEIIGGPCDCRAACEAEEDQDGRLREAEKRRRVGNPCVGADHNGGFGRLGRADSLMETTMEDDTAPALLRASLDRLGMTQRAFAECLGKSPITINRWLQGIQPVPQWVPMVIAFLEKREDRQAA
jgi:hypothetical protein